MRKFVFVIAALVLAGCSETARDQFQYIDKVRPVTMPEDTYRIREHPKGDRLMVTPSFGKIAEAGVVQGATLGLSTTLTPGQMREAAAQKYLNETGRSNCKVTSSRELMKPHFEVLFTCS